MMAHQQGWSLKFRSKASRTHAGWLGRPARAGRGSALQVPTPAGAKCSGPQLPQGVAGQLARFLPLCPPKAALLSELTALTDSGRWGRCT